LCQHKKPKTLKEQNVTKGGLRVRKRDGDFLKQLACATAIASVVALKASFKTL
jgi:hypothetical protein